LIGTVSVVIPTYNRAGTVERAVESVLGQTHQPIEIVVVDDGSSDDTSEQILRAFPRVRVLRQENLGVSAARNRGIAATSGDWIALLDSDDEWRPSKLEEQLRAIGTQPDHLICHTDEIWIRHGRRVNPKTKHAKSGGWIFEKCLPLCAISPSSVLLHRRLLSEVGHFNEDLPACEDYDLWLRVCSRYPVLFINKPLVVKYGGHPDQLSRTIWGLDRFRIQALENLLSTDELSSDQQKQAMATLLTKIDIFVSGAEKRGRLDEAEKYKAKRARWEAAQDWILEQAEAQR